MTTLSGAGLVSPLASWNYFDGLGRSVRKEATAPDNKITVTEIQYESRGAIRQKSLPYFKTLESAAGRWSTSSHDALGRVIRLDSPDGTRSLVCFNDWVTGTIDAADHRKRVTKDAYGRTVRVDEYQGTFSTCTTDVGSPYATTVYQYDNRDNLIAVTDAKGNVTTLTYDEQSRKKNMRDPDMGYWIYGYDANGNLTDQTDAKGQVTWFRYDALNRQVQKDFTTQKALGSGDIRYTYDGTTNNRKGRLQQILDASGTVVFQYDSMGRVLRSDRTLDGVTYTTQNTYDGLGRLLTVTYPGTPVKTIGYAYNGPVLDKVFEGTTTYIQYTNYNPLGQAGTTTYGNGVSTTTTYANANNTVCGQQNFRLCTLKTTGPGSGGGGGGGTSTTYNAVADFSGTQGFHGWYYLNSNGGQLTWNGNFWSGSDGYISLWDDGGHPGDSTDLVRRWVAPQAGSVQITGNTFDGDTACGVDGVQVTIKKNGTVLWQQTIAAGDTTGYSFNLSNTVAVNDQLDFVTNKLTTSSCDNTVFTPTIVLTAGGSGTTYQDLRYVYAANGNVSDIYDNLVVAGAGDQHLSYDSLDRLTLANGPYGTAGANASLTYTYDELGNLTLNSQVGTYTYPVSGSNSVRPHAVTTAGSNTYSYDSNGNLTAGAGRSLTYNLENKPLTIAIAGQTTTFVYDGDGRRVKKTAGSTVTRYVSKLYECDNASCSRMVFAEGQRIATVGASGSVYYYHTDHLGSSSVMTDSVGAKVQTVTYFPYGAIRINNSSVSPAVDVPYKYTGQEFDATTGLYDYGARQYDASLGRFISPDSLVPEPANPQSLNRYSYVKNNPFRYIDPTGHEPDDIGCWWCAYQSGLGSIGDPSHSSSQALSTLGNIYADAIGPSMHGDLSGTNFINDRLLGLEQNRGEMQWIDRMFAPYVTAADLNAGAVLLSLGGSAIKSVFEGGWNFFSGLLGFGEQPAAESLYHYGFSSDAESIIKNGLRPGMDGKIYLTTTDNLSPLQAQIDLALAPNAGLRDAVFQVDVKMLRSMGVDISQPELVPRLFNMPGGGIQHTIQGANVPATAIQRIR
ncbi:MAG: RHS repeat-associated core domain-containing protein [Nitrospira sp.]